MHCILCNLCPCTMLMYLFSTHILAEEATNLNNCQLSTLTEATVHDYFKLEYFQLRPFISVLKGIYAVVNADLLFNCNRARYLLSHT